LWEIFERSMTEKKRPANREYDLTEREIRVLDAVVRMYVASAEPAGSRSVARQFDLGVSPATVRNTMSDLEDKGFLTHPHTSAGRVPTDQAYRFFVDELIQPAGLTRAEAARLARELEGISEVERLVRGATRALGLLTRELGLAMYPSIRDSVLEKLELVQVSSDKVLMVATIRGGIVRTVYVDLPFGVPPDTLVTLTVLLNERLAGRSFSDLAETLPLRLRDSVPDDGAAQELLNIFMQASAEIFEPGGITAEDVHIGQASVLASQPEFTSGENLKSLLELLDRRDVLKGALASREHTSGLQITIGGENPDVALSDFTLVTAQYRVGGMSGIIGVIGPTRMPYEKVISIVDHTTSLINSLRR
jgi:heat-inducible transcriptional repressor